MESASMGIRKGRPRGWRLRVDFSVIGIIIADRWLKSTSTITTGVKISRMTVDST
jgi:hypothetical protein